MAGRPKKVSARQDDLAVVWMLKTLHWSDRRIARFFSHHHTTIAHWYREACALRDTDQLAIFPEGDGAAHLVAVGTSSNVENINAGLHQRPCGGGQAIRKHLNDDDT